MKLTKLRFQIDNWLEVLFPLALCVWLLFAMFMAPVAFIFFLRLLNA